MLTAAAVRSALDLLEARAQFDAPERSVHVRVAAHADRLYLDLADELEIGTEGWRVIEAPPVRFRRPEGMLALPEPRPGGSLEALRPMLNRVTHRFPGPAPGPARCRADFTGGLRADDYDDRMTTTMMAGRMAR